MLNIFISFKEIFSSAITQIAAENSIQIEEKDLKNFTVEPTKDKSHGDLACNIAMILGKKFSAIESLNNPRKLAQKIIEKTDKKDVEKIEIAGRIIEPNGSICFIGFNVRRPASSAVRSPNHNAAYPCDTSCITTEKTRIAI